jgi:hypothetical protein
MATYHDDIQVSLHGRRAGLNKDDYFITRGVKNFLAAASTAVTIPRDGLSTLSSSSGTYTLEAPMTGVMKRVTTLTTSTLVRTVTLASGNFQTTSGSSFITASFAGQGIALTLEGLSTALFQVISHGTGLTFST